MNISNRALAAIGLLFAVASTAQATPKRDCAAVAALDTRLTP